MNHKDILIYVPGLGDEKLNNRRLLMRFWNLRNVRIVLCPMKWGESEPWETKLERLQSLITQKSQEGYRVSLIGESAGASAVLPAFFRSNQKVHAVILLCGKSHHPETVSQSLFIKFPSLKDAVYESDSVVNQLSDAQKARIVNVHPLVDHVVPIADTKIAGVKNSRMPIIGHATSIIFANIFWTGPITRFIRTLS